MCWLKNPPPDTINAPTFCFFILDADRIERRVSSAPPRRGEPARTYPALPFMLAPVGSPTGSEPDMR
jgi:hypothetical protein